jgi:hypothetical protein
VWPYKKIVLDGHTYLTEVVMSTTLRYFKSTGSLPQEGNVILMMCGAGASDADADVVKDLKQC